MSLSLEELLTENNIDNHITLKKFLYNYKAITYHENNNYMILTLLKNTNLNLSSLEYNSYFVIISKNPFRILNITYDNVYFNDDCLTLLCKYKLLNYKFNIYESFEGLLLNAIYINNNWLFFSRKSTDLINNELIVSRIVNINILKKNLRQHVVYTFLVLDYRINTIINYAQRFGENYSLIFHLSSKLDNTYLNINDKVLEPYGIKYRSKLESYSLLSENINNKLNPLYKGIEIEIDIDNKKSIFTLETDQYKYALKLKPDLNKYKTFLRLYQQNLLEEHIIKYNKNEYIINTKQPKEQFKTILLIDKSVKLLAYELFELFKCVWDIKDTSHKDTALYNFLPNEYKVLLYRLKGIYFQNRQDCNYCENNEYLDKNIIFNYLKKVELDLLLKLLFTRRKMKYFLEKKNLSSEINNTFKNISLNINKLDLKMIAILTNHLFPEIRRVEI